MNKTTLLATFLCGAAATFWCDSLCRADDAGATDFGIEDLLKLPDEHGYKVDPYLKAAQSLQAMGKDKAFALLAKLADKEKWPGPRTVTLCRMLYKAKRGEKFDRAENGVPGLPGDTDVEDWPLEPIAIIDGVPIRVASGYDISGQGTPPLVYLTLCDVACDWNDFKYKPKSQEEKKKALARLIMLPKVKGKLKDGEKDFLEAQIK
jgi:hypothetical protein